MWIGISIYRLLKAMRLADITREESMGKKKKKSRNTPLRDQEKRQMKKCNREQEIEAGGV